MKTLGFWHFSLIASIRFVFSEQITEKTLTVGLSCISNVATVAKTVDEVRVTIDFIEI